MECSRSAISRGTIPAAGGRRPRRFRRLDPESALVLVQRPMPALERPRWESRWSGMLYGLQLELDAAMRRGGQ
jgi:hypothetical protein